MMTWSRRNVVLNFFRSFLSLDVSKWIYQNITQSSFIRAISIMPDLNGGPLLKKRVPEKLIIEARIQYFDSFTHCSNSIHQGNVSVNLFCFHVPLVLLRGGHMYLAPQLT